MKLTTASLVLSGALAAWVANADNKAPLLNGENIKQPVLNPENIQNDVVTLYTDATSINIAQVVESETRSVLFSTWCKENPEACKRLDEEKSKSNSESETKSNPTNVWVIVKWKTYWLWLETEQVYIEATSNFKDEIWAGAAYKFESWAVAWVSYADKKNVGSQTGVWAWYVKSFDNSYVWAWVKYTDFNAKGIYADANSVKAQVMWAYELTPWLFAEAGVSYKTFKADTYDRESRVEGSLWLAYMTPDFTARIGWTINQTSNQVMATLNFPIGGKNKVSAAKLWTSNMARFIADSSFDNSIVKIKKVPVVVPTTPTTPNTAPTSGNTSFDMWLVDSTQTFDLASVIWDAETPVGNLQIVIVSAPTYLTLTQSWTSFSVTPIDGTAYAWNDSFTYKVVDSNWAESPVNTVTILNVSDY